MARIGQVIDGKYEILKEIGRGGMSIVYLAMDKRLNKQWAVKEIPKRALDKNNEVVVQSAIAEANMIKRLDHPAIVRIVDIINNDDVIYIIEDYIEGETLGTIVENNGAQPQELVIEWAMQICEALEYLHTRKPPIIYRDMKPTNVMGTYTFHVPESNSKQSLRVAVVDAAGNEQEIVVDGFLVSTNIFARWYNNTALFWGSLSGVAVVAIGAIWLIVAGKKKKKETGTK